MQAAPPTLVKPVDLQPALDRLHNAFREGFINAQDIQKRTEIGNTDAEAQRKQNEAAKAKAEQDRKDQEGGKGYTKPSMFSRLTGIGTAPKAAVPKPALTPQGASGSGALPSGAAPAGASGFGVDMPDKGPAIPTPYLQRAQEAPDFNPAHESTDDLLNLVGEAGYSVLA